VAGKTIEAAGGIVLRKGSGKSSGRSAGTLIAVVQRAKDDAWVLPRGKLKRDENPAAAARREVVEETGHRVEVHEYLGAITYRAGRRPKVVQFWRMEADAQARHELMPDIVAVDWLPLKAAIRRLSYPLEKLFLRHAIARALKKQPVKSGKGDTGKTGNGRNQPAKVRPAKAVDPTGTARKKERVKARDRARDKVRDKPRAKDLAKKMAKDIVKGKAKDKKKDKAERQRRKAGRKKNKPKKSKNKRKS